MNREGHDSVRFFTGIEVEKTPAHGLETLFVVGIQSVDDIVERLAESEHIYFGANHSFPTGRANSSDWTRWENMIMPFIIRGYWCTLDIDVNDTEGLLETALIEHHKFIPMLSVKLPYIQQLGYNATIKLDDKDFAESNPGVWCHSLHDLMSRAAFTSWNQYSKDEILERQ